MAHAPHPSQKHAEQPATFVSHQPRRFIKLAEVKALTTLSTSEIYRRIAAGRFPAQIMLGPKSAVWLESEVFAWCDERIASNRGAVA